MTTRRNLTEPEIEARIAEIEDARVPTRSDETMLIRADEHRYEQQVTGESYHDWFGDRSPVQLLDPADEAELIRQLRASARRILGRPA